jgi:hypothetical protein
MAENKYDKRFEVKDSKGVPLMFDNKSQEFYMKLLAHRVVLEEFCRIANNLERKSKCCNKKLEVCMKFVDVDALNEYLEANDLGCDKK